MFVVVESFGTPLYKKLHIWQKVPQSSRLSKVKSYSGNAQIDGVTFIEEVLYIGCFLFIKFLLITCPRWLGRVEKLE